VKLKPLDQRLILAVALLFLVGFLLVAAFRGSFDGVNASVNSWAASINAGAFTGSAKVIAVILDTEPLFIISLAAAAVLFTLHYRRDVLLLLGAMVGDAFLVEITKTLVHSPRPVDMLIHETDYSFPSGHVTGSIVFFGVLTFLAWQHWNSSKARASTGGLYVAIVAAVDLDVLYLNVHWFSDVIGGCLLGAFWLTFSILVFRCWTSSQRFQSTLPVIPFRVHPATSQKKPSK
jgi:undecaprenyl-diphosphatase